MKEEKINSDQQCWQIQTTTRKEEKAEGWNVKDLKKWTVAKQTVLKISRKKKEVEGAFVILAERNKRTGTGRNGSTTK